MELYITRHGETSWNYENKILGRTDIPLNERGRAQARELAEKLKDVEIDVIIASPLSRALETATYIANAKNMPIRTDERLVEIDFGVFEGQDRACPEYQNSKREYFKKYSLGESFLQLTGRICCCLDMLKKEYPDKKVLLVAHGGICRIIHNLFCDMENEEFVTYAFPNCGLEKFEF
ncbi:MAG: histidine phosphatase family protein [Ruminococcus sp.]|nr:histidine phosphatase family protein [Ruminococcus sp.]